MPYNYQYPYTNPYMQPSSNSNGIIWVQGESGAKAYPVAPGNSILLMDSETQRFYIKTSDNSGMPQPLRVFNYTEHTEQTSVNNLIPTEEFHPEDYVTRAEFEEMVEKLTKRNNQYIRKEKSNGKPLV